MDGEVEMLQPFQLHFSDLLLLSSSSSSFSSVSDEEDKKRLDSLSRSVMEALGPKGPGLLAITGAPKASHLRQCLLPLARKLALLSPNDLRRVLKDHCLGSDVPLKNPDRRVSSFALQLKYVQEPSMKPISTISCHKDEDSQIANEQHPTVERSYDGCDSEFENLGSIFRELGICMMELGLQLAQVCDKAIGGRELEESILASCTAKGRLIHYHSTLDSHSIKEARQAKQPIKGPAAHCVPPPCGLLGTRNTTPMHSGYSNRGAEQMTIEDLNVEALNNKAMPFQISLSNLWQQWHYDYGIFTVLTSPMFLSPYHPSSTEAKEDGFCISYEQECSPENDHTCLLVFDTTKNKILLVRSPPESFIIQVGEAADILSKGKLCSTLHSVCRPVGWEEVSRETFVVFLQPAWDKSLSFSESPITSIIAGSEELTWSGKVSGANKEETKLGSDAIGIHLVNGQSQENFQEILDTVPPLLSRLKDGMTFAEFSRETTKQYYGGSGTQSKR